jgi:hypothetical protein
MKEKSSRDHATLKKEREALLVEIAARKKKNKKGEMILRKGATAFQIPDRGHGVKFNGSKSSSSSLLSAGRGTHRTAFAFEIHVHDGSNVKVLTVCCDTHKDRRMFIRTIQNALVTRDEVRSDCMTFHNTFTLLTLTKFGVDVLLLLLILFYFHTIILEQQQTFMFF